MNIKSQFIKKVKTRFKRDIKDPEQRAIILDKAIRQFTKKLDNGAGEDKQIYEEAFALLEELAYEYEQNKIDILEIYKEAYERHPNDTKILRTIVGHLRARDAHDKESIRYYKNLSDIDTKNFQLLTLLVDCYKRTQQPFPLMITYERIVKNYAEQEKAYQFGETKPGSDWDSIQAIYNDAVQNLAEIYANMGRTDQEAISIYKEVLHGDEVNHTVLKTLTNHYIKAERTDHEALSIYELSLAFDPEDRAVRILLSEGYITAHREKEGLVILKKIYEDNPDDEEVLDLIMKFYLDRELLNEDALPHYQDYFQKHPNDERILSLLAHFYAEHNYLSAEAVGIYKRYLSTTDKAATELGEFYRLLGRHHFNNKNWSDVIEVYEQLQKVDPQCRDTIIPLATAYSEYNRVDEDALRIYQQAVYQGSRNEKVHNLLCKYLYETGKQAPTVLKIFKDTLNLNPKNQYARLGLCHNYFQVHEYENALDEAIKHLRFYPRDEKGIEYAALSLSQIEGSPAVDKTADLGEEARRLVLEKAFSINPMRKQVIQALFDLYKKSNRLDEQAEKIYQAALPFNRENKDILILLAKCYHQKGDEKKTFHYNYEVFKLARGKCPIFRSADEKASPPKDCPEVCIPLARALLSQNRRHRDMKDILRCAYRKGETSPELIKKLGSLYLEEKKQSDEALTLYHSLVDIDPENAEARKMIVKSQMKQGNMQPVLRHCEEHLRKNPEDEETLNLLIKSLKSTPNTEERITYFLEKLHHRHPQNEKISYALALLYSFQKNYSMASLGVFLSALKTHPEEIPILVGVARCYENTGNLEQAAKVYDQILTVLPEDSTIVSRLAHTYKQLELRNPQALKVFQQALKVNPDDKELHLYLADIYFTNEDIPAGIKVIDDLLENDPNATEEIIAYLEGIRDQTFWKPKMSIKLGYLYIEMEYYDKALNELSMVSTNFTHYCGDLVEGFSRILEKEPNSIRPRIERGVIFKILGKYEESIWDLEMAYSLAGDNPNVLYELVECYASYATYLREPPLDLLTKLGRLYFQLEEYDKSIKAYQQILKKDRKSREAILNIGKAFHEKVELELALQYYMRLEMTDEVKELLYQLGDDLYALGDTDKAIDTYNQILAVDITYRDVALKIGELREEIKTGSSATQQREQIFEQLSQSARQRFELNEEVGRGTMGTVFKAYDKELDETVALKILSEKFSEDEDAQERFRLEVKSARRLSHPNVVRIHDLGEEAGRKYISMEYVDGGDLKKLLATQKRLSPNQVIEFSNQIASALDAAHKMGIIHRDIKPANILLTSDKSCKITDFGIATILAESKDLAPDIIVGTPLYMSPEQNEGKELGPTSDIYSLGVMMYEMLSGSPPFKMGNIAYHHIFTKPPTMKDVDPSLSDIVMKCLEKKPRERFRSMSDIITALEACRK